MINVTLSFFLFLMLYVYLFRLIIIGTNNKGGYLEPPEDKVFIVSSIRPDTKYQLQIYTESEAESENVVIKIGTESADLKEDNLII